MCIWQYITCDDVPKLCRQNYEKVCISNYLNYVGCTQISPKNLYHNNYYNAIRHCDIEYLISFYLSMQIYKYFILFYLSNLLVNKYLISSNTCVLSWLICLTQPVQCPRCDFTNRVRVNMLRHLKLHKEECAEDFDDDTDMKRGGGSVCLLEEQTRFDCKGVDEVHAEAGPPLSVSVKSVAGTSRQTASNGRSLLRSILSEKVTAEVRFLYLLEINYESL